MDVLDLIRAACLICSTQDAIRGETHVRVGFAILHAKWLQYSAQISAYILPRPKRENMNSPCRQKRPASSSADTATILCLAEIPLKA